MLFQPFNEYLVHAKNNACHAKFPPTRPKHLFVLKKSSEIP